MFLSFVFLPTAEAEPGFQSPFGDSSAVFTKTVCVHHPPSGVGYTATNINLPSENIWQGLLQMFQSRGFTVKYPGDEVDIEGVKHRLDEECDHIKVKMTRLCTRAKNTDGACLVEILEDHPVTVEGFVDGLNSNGMELCVPGTTIDYNGGKGVVQKDCSVGPAGATGFGDPHFKTWNGDKFDFHGMCDVVLLQNPNFADGLGLHIHIRTQIKTWWSFIESAVVQLGGNTLEIHGGKDEVKHYFNGEAVGHDLRTGEAFIGDFPVNFWRINDHQGRVRIDLGDGDAISIETYKDFVRISIGSKIIGKFEGSAGLLGAYPEGKKVARDGMTIVEDSNEFGQEWQVLPSEEMLFHDMGSIQAPQKCVMPNGRSQARRRLGESMLTEEDAAAACAHVENEDRDACIFDVIATNDKDLAGSY